MAAPMSGVGAAVGNAAVTVASIFGVGIGEAAGVGFSSAEQAIKAMAATTVNAVIATK
jgi:hypothetical protein